MQRGVPIRLGAHCPLESCPGGGRGRARRGLRHPAARLPHERWIRGTILSTSGYVAAVTPVAASPEVRAVVEAAVTSKVDAALSYAETTLPPAARGLAGSLGTGLAGVARNRLASSWRARPSSACGQTRTGWCTTSSSASSTATANW